MSRGRSVKYVIALIGLVAAREEGRIGGRRPKLSDKQQVWTVRMVQNGDKTSADVARPVQHSPGDRLPVARQTNCDRHVAANDLRHIASKATTWFPGSCGHRTPIRSLIGCIPSKCQRGLERGRAAILECLRRQSDPPRNPIRVREKKRNTK